MAAGEAGIGTAIWQRRATRLEVLSETAIAFITVVSAQRRIEIFDEQISSLDQLIPLLQRRVQEGASSPAETLRAQVAADLFRADRERAKTQLATARRDLAILMGDSIPRFGDAVGRLASVGRPPPFQSVLQAIEANPQLMRWTAVTAQRNAELILARLKPVPDMRLSAGWRHFQNTDDNAVRLGVSIPLPVFDQNSGNIIAAEEALAKTGAERAINKLVLISIAGRAYDALNGALAELKLLRTSVIPNARSASETIQGGYLQGRFTLLELLDVRGFGLAGAAAGAGSAAEFPHRRRDDRRPRRQSVFAHPREFEMIQRLIRYLVFILVAAALVYGGYRMLTPATTKTTATEKAEKEEQFGQRCAERRQGCRCRDRACESVARRAAGQPVAERNGPAQPGIAGSGDASLSRESFGKFASGSAIASRRATCLRSSKAIRA